MQKGQTVTEFHVGCLVVIDMQNGKSVHEVKSPGITQEVEQLDLDPSGSSNRFRCASRPMSGTSGRRHRAGPSRPTAPSRERCRSGNVIRAAA